ncbi:MAG: TRAP transporter small permease subunit, partial [Rhodospirillaceae bacterium]
MGILERFVRGVDAINKHIGNVTAWLTLGTVLTCFAVVVMRYAFNVGYIWMQELYVWQHATVFMVGAGYTFFVSGHVSVDVLYTRMSARRKAWIEIIGTVVFLLPWLAVLAYTTAPFILTSWALSEASAQPGGMPGVYLLKSVIWVFCALVALQGLALMARRILFLLGRDIDVN